MECCLGFSFSSRVKKWTKELFHFIIIPLQCRSLRDLLAHSVLSNYILWSYFACFRAKFMFLIVSSEPTLHKNQCTPLQQSPLLRVGLLFEILVFT